MRDAVLEQSEFESELNCSNTATKPDTDFESELESEAERENAEDDAEDEETVEAYRRPPKDLRRGDGSGKRDKKPAPRFVVDPSGAYEATSA